MMDQQRLADRSQYYPPIRGRTAGASESRSKRLNDFDDLADLAFVARQRHVLGQRVGDDQEAGRCKVAHRNRAARRDLIVAVGRDLDRDGFVLWPREWAGNPRPQTTNELILLDQRKSDEDDGPVAEQHRVAVAPDGKCERRPRDDIAALKSCEVDPLTQQ